MADEQAPLFYTLLGNRQFLGRLLIDPLETLIAYQIRFPDNEVADLCKVIDAVMATAATHVKENFGRALSCANNGCADHCCAPK